MTYRLENGQPIELGDKLGEGAQGTIHLLRDDPGTAVKIWKNRDQTDTMTAKVRTMLLNPPRAPGSAPAGYQRKDSPTQAWPTGIVTDEQGAPVGFTMPALRQQQHRTIFNYFNPQARRRLPSPPSQADMLRITRNLAAAVGGVHQAGHVIGDVNELNVLVDPRCNVTLVDTDSMQITDPVSHRIYRCTVGRDDYTPPRLQGQALRDHDRTPDDDRFGLAVLICKLLMDGQHPFASTSSTHPDVTTNVTMANKIKNEYFPYNESGQTPPEHRPSIPYQQAWQDLDFNLRHLFRRAFDPDARVLGARPTPEEWQEELDRLILNPPPRRRRPHPTPSKTGNNKPRPPEPEHAPTTSAPATPAPATQATIPATQTTPWLLQNKVLMALALSIITLPLLASAASALAPPLAPALKIATMTLTIVAIPTAALAIGYAAWAWLYTGNPGTNVTRTLWVGMAVLIALGISRVTQNMTDSLFQPDTPGETGATTAAQKPVQTDPNSQLVCDETLLIHLVFQRTANTTERINNLIGTLQSRLPQCSPQNWNPVAVDAWQHTRPAPTNPATEPGTVHPCFQFQQDPRTGRIDGAFATVGTQKVPTGLRRDGLPEGDVQTTSGRDQENNILVYWSPDPTKRPHSNAHCSMYTTIPKRWEQNP